MSRTPTAEMALLRCKKDVTESEVIKQGWNRVYFLCKCKRNAKCSEIAFLLRQDRSENAKQIVIYISKEKTDI